ncbi:AAA family ATPase, partial [Wolbachia endosymbiont of Atemnus politus]|uniref:ATP-binding protein n=1 Tax=Wolbachia endosymbiont of Atemnus politus TaxID=2682840 RepID=UPI001C55402F
SVAGTVIVLGLIIGCVVYMLRKSPEATVIKQDRREAKLDDLIIADEVKEKLRMICNNISEEKKAMLEKIGFELPRGYLFYGPPGNGKTLAVRAIAGEAGIPFFSISGGDIVSSFVNIGAVNIRELFRKAKENSPCIVFIDEIDAIGTKRSSSTSGGAKDQNLTLTQLLVEMDGFNSNKGVTVIAATNRRDILDEALLRPGRFSEHIYIPLPDLSSRERILDLYTKKVPIASDLNLQKIAEKTEDCSGAVLYNLVNDAKYNAVKRTQGQKIEKLIVTMDDFTKALNKIKSQKLENKEMDNVNTSIIEQLATYITKAVC